ncbi:MAG: c-type cytochrome [Saprospiraceae bacterium]|nr:c-type cytochrome [Saprospiraceae bacterium]
MKKILVIIGLQIIHNIAFASSKAEPSKINVKLDDPHLWVSLIMIFLLIPLFIIARAFLILLKKKYTEKIKQQLNDKSAMFPDLMVISLLIGNLESLKINWANVDWGLWVMIFVILVEISLICFFGIQLMKLINFDNYKNRVYEAAQSSDKSWLKQWWYKLNRFRSIKEEGSIDIGHNYDGIRELDNVTPPWFTYSFIATIIFAMVYMYRYHIADSAPLQMEELRMEMDIALKQKMENAGEQAGGFDENNLTYLDETERAEGQLIFESKCAVCHEKSGGSKPGGVGPNLTDKYWLHGGSLNDIYYSIKNGWPEKGMIAWADQLSPKQMAQVSSFIQSLQNSNPANSKEPQGEIYTPTEQTTNTSSDQPKGIDENNLTYLDETERAEGQLIFESKCMACHDKHGGSKPGGVGPNLTDKYWLHGGSLKDIYKTIKNGVPEKGMISWADQLSSMQIAQLASFIKSIQNSNPANAKEPQGEVYTESEIK